MSCLPFNSIITTDYSLFVIYFAIGFVTLLVYISLTRYTMTTNTFIYTLLQHHDGHFVHIHWLVNKNIFVDHVILLQTPTSYMHVMVLLYWNSFYLWPTHTHTHAMYEETCRMSWWPHVFLNDFVQKEMELNQHKI